MDIALMVLGLFALGILLMWAYAWLNDAKQIYDEEAQDVRAKTPEERERSQFEVQEVTREQNKADIEFYSRGEDADQ
ncbi:MAG: hypothetical protein JWL87_690 [Candidatus Adlerbacteria bacterium]|nr:hypothetical protein [Candidatus Adlerbacteria bacterium]